jgi:hypothetical protein
MKPQDWNNQWYTTALVLAALVFVLNGSLSWS